MLDNKLYLNLLDVMSLEMWTDTITNNHKINKSLFHSKEFHLLFNMLEWRLFMWAGLGI